MRATEFRCYFFLVVFFLAGLSDLGSGGAARILRRASSNECGASEKGLPLFPAGLGDDFMWSY